MKSTFLVKLVKNDSEEWVANCPAVDISTAASSKDQTLDKMKDKLDKYLQSEGREWLSRCGGNENIVNCSEGFVEFPIDLWKCKIDRELCPTQAQVFMDNQKEFTTKCRAPKKIKENILKTISDGKYSGFHHIVGRGICGLCKSKGNYKYHYRWELSFISDFIDIFDKKTMISLIKSGVDRKVISCGICPNCFMNLSAKFNDILKDDFESIELNIFR